MAEPGIRDLMAREVAAFTVEYPQASIELVSSGSREAVTALLGGKADLAVVTRELEPEERAVVVKGGMGLEGYRFARDAIAVVVHPDNPLERVSVDDLRAVFEGRVSDWSALRGRPGRIHPVLPPIAGDLMQSFLQRVMGGESVTAPSEPARDDSDVVARVQRDPLALGCVSMVWADRGAKALDVAALTGLPFQPLDAERVYRGDYPLTRFCSLYAREQGPRLANGLITYVSSWEGQKIVHEAGYVPTTVPVRFARRSPMLGTH